MVCSYKIVERLMQIKGVIPADVCKETGIDPSTFTGWKQGAYKPKTDKLLKLSRYFNVPIETFIVEDKAK